MKILVLGGTRFFGVHLVDKLLMNGHDVTIATRGLAQDHFGDKVTRLTVDRNNAPSLSNALSGLNFDVTFDNICYCSNDVKILLDVLKTERYILTSSVSVYEELKLDLREQDFDPLTYPLIWCERDDFDYGEVKRQSECALFQAYAGLSSAAVRFTYVVGTDDYTKRLLFYVEHIKQQKPMFIDNINEQTAFIRSDEAGAFLYWLGLESQLQGPVNAASADTVTLRELIRYTEEKTDKKAVLTADGEAAPYNMGESFSANLAKSDQAGFHFTNVKDWIYDLIDEYIAL